MDDGFAKAYLLNDFFRQDRSVAKMIKPNTIAATPTTVIDVSNVSRLVYFNPPAHC